MSDHENTEQQPDPEDNQGDEHLSPEPEPLYSEEEAQAPAEEQAGSDKDRISELEADLAEARDRALRAVAEAENTRKRLLREREDVRKYAVADFSRDLLDFSDNFSRALAAIPEEARNDELIKNVVVGVEAMEKELLKTMEKHGISKTEPMDEMFNPNFHEAMFEAPGTGKPAGTIIELIEPGYMLHDRLLRPARVGIAKDDGSDKDENPGGQVDMDA